MKPVRQVMGQGGGGRWRGARVALAALSAAGWLGAVPGPGLGAQPAEPAAPPTPAPAVAAAAAAAKHAAATAAAERARMAGQRRAIEAEFEAARAACAQRFAVNACLDTARDRRRAALAPLREREFAVDAAARQQRAAQRREAIERRQRELQAQQAADAAREVRGTDVPRTPAVPAPLIVRPPGSEAAPPPPAASAPLVHR